MSQQSTVLSKIISKIGSQAALAELLIVPPSSISTWLHGKVSIPPKHAHTIESWSDGEFTAKQIITPRQKPLVLEPKTNVTTLQMLKKLIYLADKSNVPIQIIVEAETADKLINSIH